MTVPQYGTCPWPVDTSCAESEWETFSPAVQQRSIALASTTLVRLTGYRVGNCPITVRPCRDGCTTGAPWLRYHGHVAFYRDSAFRPYVREDGQWVNGCGCSTTCGCASLCEVSLPAPVGRIDTVKANGAVVDPADYRVDNGHLLVWTGSGECGWPPCQNLALPDTEPGTFSVTYLNAYPVDGIGAYAAGVLAVEFARACAGNNCRLPNNVTMVARQGVTMEIQSGAFPNGMTGIQEVDTFIGLWNPKGLERQPTVYSPDLRRTRITTHGAGA